MGDSFACKIHEPEGNLPQDVELRHKRHCQRELLFEHIEGLELVELDEEEILILLLLGVIILRDELVHVRPENTSVINGIHHPPDAQ